jgi:hypothetical protein
MLKIGSRTPWGKADNAHVIAPGIQRVSTSSHGGFKLDKEANEKVPAPFREKGGWYEEDVLYAVVFATFPEVFGPEPVINAHATLKNYYPDKYAAAYNVEVSLEESHVLRERAFRKEAEGQLQTFAAWGDWHAKVPQGMVGVVARVDGREGTGPDRYFLVPQDEYASRSGCTLIIDPTKYKEIEAIS